MLIPRINDVTRITRTSPQVEPTSYSEEALWEASWTNRKLETTPPTFERHPVGMFAASEWGTLYQLREYDVFDPRIVLHETPYQSLINKYVKWIQDGSMPPPLTAYEGITGRIIVSDGHHRMAALRQAGIEKVQMWVLLLEE